VPGWSAVVGTNIEFQNITPKETGNPYVELKAEPAGHYGIQQEVGTSKGATYLLMLDCRDRPDVGPECSNFNVLIDGEIKCKINFSAPTATTPPDKFVAPSAWTTVAVPFTATRPITLISLVPVNTLDDITGCLVDNVNLLPVEVVVRKKAESTAPATGLLVKKGDMITFDINGAAPASEFPLPPETVKWKLRQLKHDGTTTNWTDVSGQGPELDFTTNESGVFEAKAVLTPQGGQAQDFPLTRKKDAPHADSSAGVVQEFHKAGAVDYFGVADAQWQIDLRNTALGNLGSDYYKNEGECVVQGSTTAPNPSNKCNIFIYHKCGDAGAPVPLTRGGIPGWRTGPPLAIDWWNDNSGRTDDAGRTITSFDIPNWSRLPDATMPQPGLVVAHPSLAGNPDQYSSHVGIFDYDGSWISAGFAKVNKYYHPKTVTSDGPYQPQSYRKFTGGNQP